MPARQGRRPLPSARHPSDALGLCREVGLKVPRGPAQPARAAIGAGLGNGCSFVVFLFQHVFLLRLENGGATWLNRIFLPFSLRGFTREGAWIPPLAVLSGLNLWKAKKKAAGGSGVQERRWHNDSLISAAVRREITKWYYANSFSRC